ncbi:hypothetical protein [Spirosoma endophyticum]|uniref:Uncharacterized protein n=1 Tax=Spirosoma endophyticum TaxID=662367 RepID=A0A1I1X7Q3_9BACT|nr:hypothetical protein [Spirosoma endophyticum]SFE03377.1 hypothetical protein SAMN05216167_109200 [Spirosoma endophyticum]
MAIELFGKNYFKLRNEYIIPLITYSVSLKKIDNWNLKKFLAEEVQGVNRVGDTYDLVYDSAKFYSCLVAEIEHFYTKAVLQLIDLQKSNNLTSPIWSAVTQYYFSFFSATLLLRITRKGFVFFDKEQLNNLSNNINFFTSSSISLESSNYFFDFIEETTTGTVIVKLVNKGEGVHKLTWFEAKKFLDTSSRNCGNDEKTIIKSLISLCSAYKSNFPADVRNSINYQGPYAIQSIRKTIYPIACDYSLDNILKELVNINPLSGDEINKKIRCSSLYGYYLFLIANRLYNEYLERSGKSKYFETLRNQYYQSKDFELGKYLV